MSSKKTTRLAEVEARVEKLRATYAAAEKMVASAKGCREVVGASLLRALRELRELREA